MIARIGIRSRVTNTSGPGIVIVVHDETGGATELLPGAFVDTLPTVIELPARGGSYEIGPVPLPPIAEAAAERSRR